MINTLIGQAEENDNHNKSETGPVSHKQTPSSNGLMNTIQAIFGSANGPLITKQELLQKIITINLDILDIGMYYPPFVVSDLCT